MLRIPAPGEATPRLLEDGVRQSVRNELHKQNLAENTSEGGELIKKRRLPRQDVQPDWEKQTVERRSSTGKKTAFLMLVVAGGILVGTLGFVLVVMFLERTPTPVVVISAEDAPAQILEGEEPPSVVLPEIAGMGETALIAEAEKITRDFMNAETVEEILPLVRDREKAEPRIRKAYPDGKIAARGVSTFNSSGIVGYRGNMALIGFTTRDFSDLKVAVVSSPQGLKIDWESFAGWSDSSWEDFIRKRSAKPLEFRLLAEEVDYYNFEFSDESKWRCYRLSSPDEKHVLYGYAKLGSQEDTLLRPDSPKSAMNVILAIKFPVESSSENQVIIDRFVTDGWVEGVKDK